MTIISLKIEKYRENKTIVLKLKTILVL